MLQQHSPAQAPAPAPRSRPPDLVTYETFRLMMIETGRAPAVRTVQRWVMEDHLSTWPDPTDPHRRRQQASVSDLLDSHRRRQT